jgi:hypothetical protein
LPQSGAASSLPQWTFSRKIIGYQALRKAVVPRGGIEPPTP